MRDKPLIDLAKRFMAFDGQDVRATAAIEYFNTTPAHHHPEDPWRQRLMKGVQEGLRRLGYRVEQSGVADAITARALVGIVGPRWRWTTWSEIYRSLARAGAR